MLGTIIFTLIVLAIIWVIYIEYKNTQQYNKRRAEKRNHRTPPPYEDTIEEPTKKSEIAKPKPAEEVVVTVDEVEIEPEPEVILEEPTIEEPTIEEIVEEKVEVEVTPAEELPLCDYPAFDHSRTVETLGLSEEDAKEFVGELISQLDTHIPLLSKEIEASNFHELEKLTHSIKGSATNLGTGGVSDLLVDFNTYLKEGTNIDIVKNYFTCLENYTQQLKEQYA